MLEENPLLSLLGMLGSVILILGLAYWFTRYVVGAGGLDRFGWRQHDERLRVLDRTPLGKDQHLAVVQIGARYFAVGVTTQNINLLSELTEEEAAPWLKDAAQEGMAAMSGFQQTLLKTWQKKRGGEEQ